PSPTRKILFHRRIPGHFHVHTAPRNYAPAKAGRHPIPSIAAVALRRPDRALGFQPGRPRYQPNLAHRFPAAQVGRLSILVGSRLGIEKARTQFRFEAPQRFAEGRSRDASAAARKLRARATSRAGLSHRRAPPRELFASSVWLEGGLTCNIVNS